MGTVLFLAAVFVIFVLLTHEPSINYGREIRLLEKKTSPTVASAAAEAASGVCLQADNAEEIQSAEAAAAAVLAAAEATAAAAELTAEAVVTKEEPPFSDEMESE